MLGYAGTVIVAGLQPQQSCGQADFVNLAGIATYAIRGHARNALLSDQQSGLADAGTQR